MSAFANLLIVERSSTHPIVNQLKSFQWFPEDELFQYRRPNDKSIVCYNQDLDSSGSLQYLPAIFSSNAAIEGVIKAKCDGNHMQIFYAHFSTGETCAKNFRVFKKYFVHCIKQANGNPSLTEFSVQWREGTLNPDTEAVAKEAGLLSSNKPKAYRFTVADLNLDIATPQPTPFSLFGNNNQLRIKNNTGFQLPSPAFSSMFSSSFGSQPRQ